MKIAYDHQIFSGQRYGGISRYFCEIAARIGSFEDCRVRIIAPFHINAFAKNTSPTRLFGIWTPAIPKTQRLRQTVNAAVVRRLLANNPPDVVHETYYDELGVAPRSSAVIVTVHDMIHETLPHLMPPHDETSRFKAAAVRRADHVICVSENTRKDLIDITGVHPGKTSVVYLGSSLCARPQREEIKSAWQQPFILYVGVRAGYKNFTTLLQAFRSSSRLRRDFNLVCFGGPSFSDAEMREYRRWGVEARIARMTGGDEVLHRLYLAARCLVYPSLYEGFGIPILEAMACECPVVCSSTGSMPEVAGDAAKYFDPVDVDSITSAMEKVVYSQDTRGELILRGKSRATQFSWDRCAKQTLDVYRSSASSNACN